MSSKESMIKVEPDGWRPFAEVEPQGEWGNRAKERQRKQSYDITGEVKVILLSRWQRSGCLR